MAVKIDGAELYLAGYVGDDLFDDGFSSGQVVDALAKIGRKKDITLRINSGGGLATEGAAIYAALASHKGKVKVIVEGIAASAASLIAMAGTERLMAPGAILMIHDPLTLTHGNVADHEAAILQLDALGEAYAGIYAEAAGIRPEKAREFMRDELWMTAEKAIELGFATGLTTANQNEPTAFAYSLYRRAPEPLVALAHAKGWKPRAHLAAPPAAQPTENTMADATAGTATTTTETETTTTEAATTTETTVAATDTGAEAAVTAALAQAGEIIALCTTEGVPAMAANMVAAKITLDQARAQIVNMKQIREVVAHARKVNPAIEASVADSYIAAGKTAEQVRADLFEKIVAAQSPDVATHSPSQTKPSGDDVWSKHIEAQNARVTR